MAMSKLCIGTSDKIRESEVVPGRLIFNRSTNTLVIDSPTSQRLPLEILGISTTSIDDCNHITTDINDSIYSYNNSFHVYKTSANTTNVPAALVNNGNGLLQSTVSNGIVMQKLYSISTDGTFNGEWRRFGTTSTNDNGTISVYFGDWEKQTNSDANEPEEIADFSTQTWASEGVYDISNSSNTSILLEDQDDTLVAGYAKVSISSGIRKVTITTIIEHDNEQYAIEYFRIINYDGKSTDYIVNSIEKLDSDDDSVNITINTGVDYTRAVTASDISGLLETGETLVNGCYTTSNVGDITKISLEIVVTNGTTAYACVYNATQYNNTRTNYVLVNKEVLS